MAITRRNVLSLGGLGVAAGTTAWLVGCSNRSQAPTPAADGSTSPVGSTDGVFPVSVTHAFGTTTVPAAPQRVVSVGVTEQDPLLALGVMPVGVTEWYGEQPSATWPWAQPLLAGAEPTVLSTADGFDFEAIAALAPDLIVGTNSGMTADDYAKLGEIAPTVAHAGGYASEYFEPWWVQTQLIGDALGRHDQATQLVAGLRQRFADAAAAHPEFAGTTVIFLQGAFDEGAAIASPPGLATDFLTDLGFVVPTGLEPFVKDGAQAYVPLEQLSVLDAAQVLVWATDDAAGAKERDASPFYRRLAAVEAGRSVDTGEILAAATYVSSVLSFDLILEQLVPRLADALA